MKRRTWDIHLLGIAGALVLVTQAGLAQTTTAQSAMFVNSASGNFIITGTEVWSYNKDTAATYFSNTLSSGPAVTCAGSPTNCNLSNQPPAPAAPAPDSQKLTPHVGNQSCNFWNGLQLVLTAPTSYTQFVTINGLNGNGNWKFEWTYTIGFADGVGGPYAPRTAWDIQSDTSGGAEVTVAGFFAGQSTQQKGKGGADKWTFKASHTMTNSDGSSRLVDARAKIFDADANLVCELIINTALELGVDFLYDGNAGRNGALQNLIDNELVSKIQQGLKAAPSGKVDDFPGNNFTNGERAVISSTTPASCSILQAGSYTIQVTGVLKGVAGSTSLPISVTSSLCISAGDCSVCP